MLRDYYSTPIILNEKQMKDFITFDNIKKQKRWKKCVSLAACLFMLATVTKQQALIIPNTVNEYEDIWKFITDKLDKLQIHQEKY